MMHGTAGNKFLPDFYPFTPAVNRLHDANDKLETTCSNLTMSLSNATTEAASYSNIAHTNATSCSNLADSLTAATNEAASYSNLVASYSNENTKLNAEILR
jgi:hypothetical protein